ncbi:MAG: AF1514 family protein [Thermoanaerobaculales bacterium]|nr:AF1514 family protein [Thermoanaerobaculales bacterium]
MSDPMQTLHITTHGLGLDFATAKRLADDAADRALDGPICLSWFDRAADRESPAHASECHDACDIPGYIDYAVNRGAELKVVVDRGAYVFCYRPIGEFAG